MPLCVKLLDENIIYCHGVCCSAETMKYIQHLEERIDLLENQLRKQLDKSKTENPWLSTANISQAMKVNLFS